VIAEKLGLMVWQIKEEMPPFELIQWVEYFKLKAKREKQQESKK
jgi:hypothetical protein